MQKKLRRSEDNQIQKKKNDTSVFFKDARAPQALESRKSPANTAICIEEERKREG